MAIVAKTNGLQPVMQQFLDLVQKNNWRPLFDEAIKKVNALNIPEMKDLNTFDNLVKFMNEFLTWVPFENKFGDECLQQLCRFYFIFDQEPVKSLQNAVVPHDKEQPLTPLSAWIKEYIAVQGNFLNTSESLTPETFKTFMEAPDYHMDEYIIPNGGFKTFNELFARRPKPGYRPIAAIEDSRVITAAAEATFAGFWEIDGKSEVLAKGLRWKIQELLEGSPYADRFKGGMWTHSFLNTNDYHRQNAPVSGTVVEARVIQGTTYVNIAAEPDPVSDETKIVHHQIDAPDIAGYEFMQTRGLIIIDSPIGLVAVMPIGMSNVSSVIITTNVGDTLKKGDEISYFQFGGSDYVMVFERKSNVSFTAQKGYHYKMGTRIADSFPVIDPYTMR